MQDELRTSEPKGQRWQLSNVRKSNGALAVSLAIGWFQIRRLAGGLVDYSRCRARCDGLELDHFLSLRTCNAMRSPSLEKAATTVAAEEISAKPRSDDWMTGDWVVMLLDAGYPDGVTLKSVLQAMGAQVLIGPHTAEANQSPLIVVHAWNRDKPEVSFRIKMARSLFPDALVCFVTGKIKPQFSAAIYDDARCALVAAGVWFVCNEFEGGPAVGTHVASNHLSKTDDVRA